jgi:2-polyprenyl-3-methyl-5-hydroxy-6-metoxy-1,4-benzoquinol methylase
MTVRANFEDKYRFSEDPWQTLKGDKSDYYDWLFGAIEKHAGHERNRLLDIGCGEGHFTARCASLVSQAVVGVDISDTAVERARLAHPSVRFDVADLSARRSDLGRFEIVCCSQVLYYLTPAQLNIFWQNLYDALASEGIAVLVANCSGGDYFEPDEFNSICASMLEPEHTESFGQHQLFIGSKRGCQTIVSVDYEVREHGDALLLSDDLWQKDVFLPCSQLLEVCESAGARLTIFAEMAQYWFLEHFAPSIAETMRTQWVDAVRRGHDVQVHMHTRWLTQSGARVGDDKKIRLAMGASRLHDLDDRELEAVLGRAKRELEALLQPLDPNYQAVAFRAGKYQIQPHERIFEVLSRLGYRVDSSVWHGGFLSAYDRQPGFDFRMLWHPYRCYWPNRYDINRPAAKHEMGDILEVPILANDRVQWAFDNLSDDRLVEQFQANSAGGGMRIMIGHTKVLTNDAAQNLKAALLAIGKEDGNEFSTLRRSVLAFGNVQESDLGKEMEAVARYSRRSLEPPEVLYDSLDSYHRRKVSQIADVAEQMAADRTVVSILDTGCGTGELVTFPLAHALKLRGVRFRLFASDLDMASIDRAQERAFVHELADVTFQCAFTKEVEGVFDLVVCSEVLEHLEQPEALVSDLGQKVAPQGRLLLTTPNGYGYKELERRVLSIAYDIVMISPSFVRNALLKVRRAVKRRQGGRPASARPARAVVIGTLNYENDIHIQFFRFPRLRAMLTHAGFSIDRVSNTQVLGGVFGSLIDSRLGLERWIDKWPTSLAGGWSLVARRTTEIAAKDGK